MANFRRFGIMLDVSRNGVLKVEQVKSLIDDMQKMGYNCLELYMEDTYEIEGEPFFGYLRGRYTGAELKEIDAYAVARGIELIPCIQTLAHFTALVRHAAYKDIVDVNDILLIDEPKTYALIDKIFKTLAENFTSRLVNIGMDEAHMVGLGKYLTRFGFADRTQLLLRHLNKVADIAKKYGFKAHMWSDMFFRLLQGGTYGTDGIQFSKEIADKIPDNVELIYWDYYHVDKAYYDKQFAAHKTLGENTWFAGGAWAWNGFAPLNWFSLKTMKPAMESAREQGVNDVLITIWGDNGRECSHLALLPSLYAIKQYGEGNFDEQSIKRGFAQTFGVAYDDFMLLDIPNRLPIEITDQFGNATWYQPSKVLLYADPFMGIFDKEVEEVGDIPYGEYAKQLEEAKGRSGKYAYLFDMMQKLCEVLASKATLGIRTRKAYAEKDKTALTALVDEYALAADKVDKFHAAFYTVWHSECKPQGWEIQDARLGGLKQRLSTCRSRLIAYLGGSIDKIPELEEEILMSVERPRFQCNRYDLLISNCVF